MKKLIAAIAIFYAMGLAWATPDTELIEAETGSVYLYTDSVEPLAGESQMFNAVLVVDMFNTIPNEKGIAVNCVDRTIRANWTQPQREMVGSLPGAAMRTTLSTSFARPAPGSAEEAVINRVCSKDHDDDNDNVSGDNNDKDDDNPARL